MTIALPPNVLKTLPEPDSQGLVRVVMAIQVNPQGEANIAEINDVPVTSDGEEPDENASGEDDSAEQDQGPSADDIDAMVHGGGAPAQAPQQ